MVGGATVKDENSIWIIKGPHKDGNSYLIGTVVKHGETIRLEHLRTGKNLHSHSSPSPITKQNEVTAYGAAGVGDGNDDWVVDLGAQGSWLKDVPMRLAFGASGTVLHSHGDHADPTLTAGLQEVTTFGPKRDSNDLWKAEYEDLGTVDSKGSGEEASDASGTQGAGTEVLLNRAASDHETCLDIRRYAEILKTFFSQAGEEEFCFALFGHWGRGKTFLIDQLGRILTPTEIKIVRFSAWKYPNTPEVWVHLYETLADAACEGAKWSTIPRNIRVGIAKHGAWPLIGGLAVFAVGLFPKLWILANAWTWLRAALPVVGLGGLVWIILFASGIRGTIRRLSHRFLSTARHAEKLGLQATIGKDLAALLKGWMPKDSLGNRFAVLLYFIIVLGVGWSAWLWFEFPNSTSVASPCVRIAAVGLIIVLGFAAFCWAMKAWGGPKRILLVVDDLDRCPQEQLLSVVESIKLLVEDREVSRRMQVVMLIEEDILNRAILKKYEVLRDASKGPQRSKKFTAENILRENCEKLFSAHLRLPPLSREEVRDILFSFAAANAEQSAKLRNEAKARERVHQYVPPAPVMPASASPIAPEIAPVAQSRNPDASAIRETYILSALERRALWTAIETIGLPHDEYTWGPRSIRGVIFRYQLARLILNQFGLDWRPQALADTLVTFMVKMDSPIADGDPRLKYVAMQVS
jgi:hypothetical protein